MTFENIKANTNSNVNSGSDVPHVNKSENLMQRKERLQDEVYNEFMGEKIRDEFFDSMSDYFEEDVIDQMRVVLIQYKDKEVLSAVSLPFELRNPMFERFQSKMNEGFSPEKVMKDYIDMTIQHGFTVGYHVSNKDIKPTENGKWEVKPSENDHRDNDLKMMYYSKRFRHLYKEKGVSGYIYVIRTEYNDRTDGSWYRRMNGSVVMRVPFSEVLDYVTEETDKRKNGR